MNVTATLIGQILAFLGMIWFIRAFLWDPMMNMMEDRRKRIADGLAAAERGAHEEELAQQRATERLREVKAQASEIIEQANRRASEIVEGAKETAHSESERIKEQAQADLAQDTTRAREQLRQQVVAISVAGAERILQREVDDQAHARALDDLVAGL